MHIGWVSDLDTDHTNKTHTYKVKLELTPEDLLRICQKHISHLVKSVELVDSVDAKARELIAVLKAQISTNKIPTIKAVRDLTQCGLKQAKDFVEMDKRDAYAMIAEHGLEAPNKL